MSWKSRDSEHERSVRRFHDVLSFTGRVSARYVSLRLEPIKGPLQKYVQTLCTQCQWILQWNVTAHRPIDRASDRLIKLEQRLRIFTSQWKSLARSRKKNHKLGILNIKDHFYILGPKGKRFKHFFSRNKFYQRLPMIWMNAITINIYF